jgi:hypothetical protein
MARSSLTWISLGISLTSSRKRVPPSASSKRPGRLETAPVKAPRSWPKSSLSTRPAGKAAQLTLMKGWLAARGAEVQGAGDELLAGAALGGDEDGGGAGGDLVHGLADRLHVRRAADHAGVGTRVFELLGGLGGDCGGAGAFAGDDRLLDDLVDLVAVEGLLQVVEGAELDGLDGRIDGAVGGQQDHREVRLVQGQGAQQADAVEVGHAQVGDHDVEGARRGRAYAGQRGGAVGLGVDLVALLPQQRPEDLAQVGFVVDQEDAVLCLGHG